MNSTSRVLRTCGLAVLLLHSIRAPRTPAALYSIDILIDPFHPEMFDSWLFGINNQGQTTGYTVTRDASNHFVQSAITYRTSVSHVLASGSPGGLGTSGLAINAGGDVVGNASNQLTFFASGGGTTPIEASGFDFPTARGLNDTGSVLINDYPSDLYYNAERFAVWKSGTSQRISALDTLYPDTLPPDPNDFSSGPSTSSYSRSVTGLNNSNQFAASVNTIASDPHNPNDPNDDTFTEQYAYAYVFNGHDGYHFLQPPNPGDVIDPIAIDAAGSVLGWAGDRLARWDLDGAVESVLPDPETSLKHIGGFGYSSVAWNGLGQIVALTTASGVDFYDPISNAWTDITSSIAGLGTGAFSTIQGFNDAGQFVGLVRPGQGGGVFGYVVSPVPEPSSLGICMCGLIFATGIRHRSAHRTKLPAAFGLAATLLLVFVANRAEAIAYKASVLNVTGYNNPDAVGISGSSIVGLGSPISGVGGAFLLDDAAQNVVELNPASWAAQPNAVSGDSQVGHGTGPATAGNTHAILWHGTAASLVDLNPTGFSNSYAYGVSGNSEVGEGYGTATGGPAHALLWHGTAASVVDLHPAAFLGSLANKVFGDDIVGEGQTADGKMNALLWQGSDHTVVNLHSATYPFTYANDVSADSQVGTGLFSLQGNGARHALLWYGTAASVVDLNPAGFTQTEAYGVAGAIQVGYGKGTATGSQTHAMLWQSSAASFVDLHALLAGLGHTFTSSTAMDISANGVIVGYASDSSNASYAVKWTPIIPGDFNGDAIVDAADYVTWRNGLGTTYTQSDYDVWRANFGQTSSSGAGANANAAVPEPAAAALIAIAVTIVSCRRRNPVLLVGLLWAAASTSCLAITYTTLDYPGSVTTEALGVDGSSVVGYYVDSSNVGHGFLYNGSTYTALNDPLGTTGTFAVGISGGNIVGIYHDSSFAIRGFLYDGSTYKTLDDPLGIGETIPTGISGSNVVGYYVDSSDSHRGFLYNGATYTDLNVPSATNTELKGISGSNIVGQYSTPSQSHGFLYDGSSFTPLDVPLGTEGAELLGISGANIVGYYIDSSFNGHGFFYDGSTYTTLDNPLGTFGTFANGISGNKVVGSYSDASKTHGFLTIVPEPGNYDGNGIVDAADYVVWRSGLGTTYTQSDYNVWRAHFGHSAGGGAGAGATSANAAVPEPSGMGLLLAAVGLLGLVIFVQRRETLVATFLLGTLVIGGSATTSFAIPFITLDDDPAGLTGSTQATGISGSNIVGTYFAASVNHGFLYNGSTYTTLDDPLGTGGTVVTGISGSNIVGFYTDSSSLFHGFLFNGSTYTTLDHPLGPGRTFLLGISGSNIIGHYSDGSPGDGHDHAFLYNGSNFIPLEDPLGIGDTSVSGISGNNIVGTYGGRTGISHGFLYNGSTYTTVDDPLGLGGTAPAGISGNNIVGYYQESSGFVHGFLYNGSSYTTFDFSPTTETIPNGIDGNKIVGVYGDGSPGLRSFVATFAAGPPGDFNLDGTVDAADYVVWRNGLGTSYTQSDYNLWRSHFGQMAGSGSGSIANSAVPEPRSLSSFLLALCL